MSQTLVAGEIQMAQMGGPAMLAAGVAGMDVTFVAVALNTTPIVIMGNVSRMEELKGKGIGVTRYGSNTDISARYEAPTHPPNSKFIPSPRPVQIVQRRDQVRH
jgi:ABC-type nitrate/sulfonate/bicarbonate transport system substrate-binding protein